jgi:hypothetical protein
LALRREKDVPGSWSYADCTKYIEWCHIGKVFPEEQHNKHQKFSKSNLNYCLNPTFKQQCIEVYLVVYKLPHIYMNEANVIIYKMVWIEPRLQKLVDWTTFKCQPSIYIPTKQDIPWGMLKYLEEG